MDDASAAALSETPALPAGWVAGWRARHGLQPLWQKPSQRVPLSMANLQGTGPEVGKVDDALAAAAKLAGLKL